MRLAWALLAVVTGCQTDHPDYPINPGGGFGTGSQGHRDANEGSNGDGGPTITGKVCVMTDLRRLDTCTTVGASNLTITIGTKTARTDVAGNFTIDTPVGANLVWRVESTIPSVIPFSASTTLYVVDAATYTNDLNANGVLLADQEGSILARVERGGVGVAGARGSTTPPSGNAIFYDGNNATVWDQDSAGAFGMIWVPGVPVGSANLRVTPPAATAIDTPVLVENQAITFVTIDAP